MCTNELLSYICGHNESTWPLVHTDREAKYFDCVDFEYRRIEKDYFCSLGCQQDATECMREIEGLRKTRQKKKAKGKGKGKTMNGCVVM